MYMFCLSKLYFEHPKVKWISSPILKEQFCANYENVKSLLYKYTSYCWKEFSKRFKYLSLIMSAISKFKFHWRCDFQVSDHGGLLSKNVYLSIVYNYFFFLKREQAPVFQTNNYLWIKYWHDLDIDGCFRLVRVLLSDKTYPLGVISGRCINMEKTMNYSLSSWYTLNSLPGLLPRVVSCLIHVCPFYSGSALRLLYSTVNQIQ